MSDNPTFLLETGKLASYYTIPMLLTCPACDERHIDEDGFAEVAHHTHACQHCGTVWRPAKVNTHGVQFLPGYRNASVNTLPKGGDGEAGSVRSKGSAVPAEERADAQPLDSGA